MRAIFNVSVVVEGQSHKTAGMETNFCGSQTDSAEEKEKRKKKEKKSAGEKKNP